MWASQGNLISSEEEATSLANDFLNMDVIHLKDGKHYLQEDHPKKISYEILKWLKKVQN